MKKINIINSSLFALVDDDKYEELIQYKWYLNKGYGVTHKYIDGTRKLIKMHHFILKPENNLFIDHINRNRLDNRRSNLRLVTNHTNQRNSKISVKNTSGYKGVYWDKKYKRWCARATVFGKKIFGGGFLSKEDAARVYERIIQIYG